MSDGFWVLAYILAGIINVMGVFKFYEWLYEHDMNQSEKRDYELMNSAMSAHPGFKALLCLLLWVFWPLISLICTSLFLFLFIPAAVLDTLEWVLYKIRGKR